MWSSTETVPSKQPNPVSYALEIFISTLLLVSRKAFFLGVVCYTATKMRYDMNISHVYDGIVGGVVLAQWLARKMKNGTSCRKSCRPHV